MPALTHPNLGLSYGWDFRESGWKDGMDENLRKLGAVIHLAITAFQNDPPTTSAEGDRYVVGVGTGAWLGHDNEIALYIEGAWTFYPPRVGWVLWNQGTGKFYRWDGAAWVVCLDSLGAQDANAVAITGGTATLGALYVIANGTTYQITVDVGGNVIAVAQ